MVNLLRGVLICSPFIHYLMIGTRIRTSQALLSILLEFIVILFFLNMNTKRKVDFKALSVFWLYIVINSLWYILKGFSNGGLSVVSLPLIHISLFFLFYSTLATHLNERDYFKVADFVILPT